MSVLRCGQKVVCIQGNWPVFSDYEYDAPVKDQIYTVREIRHCRVGPVEFGCRLEEIRNPVGMFSDGFAEIAFNVIAFRPLTDISDLVKLTKVRELEDA